MHGYGNTHEMRKSSMKAVWIGIGIVCVAVLAITVVFITTPHDFREEENRSDGVLLHATEDEPLEKHVPFFI